MNTTENNKIIAEFMGVKPKCEMDGVYSYSDMPFFSIRENDIDKVIEGIAKYSKYHSDWKWLMPVVEKIESLENNRFAIEINQGHCNIYDLVEKEEIISYFNESKITTTYLAVYDFINWHNQQNE